MTERSQGVARAAVSTVGSLFSARARIHPDRVAVEDGARTVTYGEAARRTLALAQALRVRGVKRGDRIGILSENRAEYLEVFLAAARLGAVVACPSWRATPQELTHCLDLVAPSCTFASPRYAERLGHRTDAGDPIVFGTAYEQMATGPADDVPWDVDPEDALLILYTSG